MRDRTHLAAPLTLAACVIAEARAVERLETEDIEEGVQ